MKKNSEKTFNNETGSKQSFLVNYYVQVKTIGINTNKVQGSPKFKNNTCSIYVFHY
jgi:hypothetical protein